MGSGVSAGNQEVITITTFMKAVHEHQLSLKFQINSLTIRSNYNKSNPAPKHEQESIHMSKITKRKIIEINRIKAQLRRLRRLQRCKSKFLTVLHVSRKEETVLPIPASDFEPDSLISTELVQLEDLKQHFQGILSVLCSLREKVSKNQARIDENMKKAFQLSKAKNEVVDLKHYKSYLLKSSHFLSNKKTVKYSERKIFARGNSAKFANKLVMISKSRELIQEYTEKVRVLRERTSHKMESVIGEHEKVVGRIRGTPDEGSFGSAQRELEACLRKEKHLQERLAFWKKQKEILDHSQTSTSEFTSKEEVSGKTEGNLSGEKDFDEEWKKYNLKFHSTMEFFNDITSSRRLSK